MKTKIIYISGNEVFEMSEIRAAFEEVRCALGLDKDTILFGVPVDEDNALAQTNDLQPAVQSETVVCDVDNDVISGNAQQDIVPEIPCTPSPIMDIPDNDVDMVITEPEPDIAAPIVTSDDDEDKVIPILSVLGGGAHPVEEETDEEVISVTDAEQEIIAEVNVQDGDTLGTDMLQISIEDVVAEQAPVEEKEKTLEELLESMTPMGEDVIPEPISESEEVTQYEEDAEQDFSVSMTDDMTDTDATLAQLANEFAQTQDQIPDTTKTSGNGKISKLKNILPFKKAKSDDGGLMGDLFGWAGIAANDEEFSIPGFFTSAGGQK